VKTHLAGVLRIAAAAVVAVGAALVPLAAQSKPSVRTPDPGYVVPRTPDGKPDLQGVWANNSVTPMTRPTQWKDRDRITEAELAELQQIVQKFTDQGGDAIFQSVVQMALDAKEKGEFKQVSYDATTGNYNQFWMAERDWDTRTSLIIDPPNGQYPAFTPEGMKRAAALLQSGAGSESGPAGAANGPEDRPLNERCITYGAPLAFAGYNAYQQIIQSPETVVILQEMIHDARIVPIGSQPHLPNKVRQWHGDSRGRWEGDTLVVETTNFSVGNLFLGTSPELKLTERYTRVSKDFINWELTVDDPATWVKPWTFMIRLKRSDDQLYEYACHEGNHSMVGMLAGARAAEAKAAAGAGRTGSR
jgi:hypothetical protein